MIVFDTTFLIDLIRGDEEALKISKSHEFLLTTQINMYEVVKGFFIAKIAPKKILEIIELFKNIKMLSLDEESIVKSAEIYSDALRNGVRISNSDSLIAGIALTNGVHKIVTKNAKHFEKIKGLKIVSY